MGMNLFGGHNPLRKRKVETSYLPTNRDVDWLKDFCKRSRRKKITAEERDRMSELEEGMDEVMAYNDETDPEGKLDADDFRLIQLPHGFTKYFFEAKDMLEIVAHGGSINAMKKAKLKRLLQQQANYSDGEIHNVRLVPRGYNWEAEFMRYYPEDYDKKLDKKGNWILILEDWPIEAAPAKYSIHFATPEIQKVRCFGDIYKLHFANILTNGKEVKMLPNEFIVIRDANWLLDNIDKGITMIEGSASAKLDKNKVFYLKSRGFTQAEIYQILFRSVTSKNFCHFVLDPEVCDFADNVRVGMTPNMAKKVTEHMMNLPNITFKKP